MLGYFGPGNMLVSRMGGNSCLQDPYTLVEKDTCCLGVMVRLFSRLMGIGLGVCTGKGL